MCQKNVIAIFIYLSTATTSYEYHTLDLYVLCTYTAKIVR